MLKEAKKAMRVTAEVYDSEIAGLLEAGARELEIAGVVLPGTVSFTYGENDAVTDTSTLTDPLVMRALFTFARMRFGSPPDYDKLADAWELQKVQLMHATGYTDYGEEPEPEPGPDPEPEPETEPETNPEGGDDP